MSPRPIQVRPLQRHGAAVVLPGALLAVMALAGPAEAQVEPARDAHRLPTGLSFQELRSVLSSLRPITALGDPATPAAADPGGLGLGGLVVDETATKIGRDFYEVFYSAWEPPTGVRSFTVRIQEQPAPGLGTRVVLLIDDEILGQIQLQPRYEVVEELARSAAAVVRDEVIRRRPVATPEAAAGNGGGSGDRVPE